METMQYLDWSARAPAVAEREQAKHLLFELRGWSFALPSLWASGIVRREEVGRLHEMPGMEPPLKGMVNHLGNALPIFDFGWDWGGEGRGEALVLLGAGSSQLGFWVDALPKGVKMQERYDRAGSDSVQLPEGVRRCASGVWRLRGKAEGAPAAEWVVEMASYDELTGRFKLG